MLKKAYLEITNVCNMDCSFCHKTAREKRVMSEEEFELLTDRLRGKTEQLYFHLMGEPLLHPDCLEQMGIAISKGRVHKDQIVFFHTKHPFVLHPHALAACGQLTNNIGLLQVKIEVRSKTAQTQTRSHSTARKP